MEAYHRESNMENQESREGCMLYCWDEMSEMLEGVRI